MFKATQVIADYLDAEGIKYSVNESERVSSVGVRFQCDNLPSIGVIFFSNSDDNDVSARVFSLVHVPEDKVSSMPATLNELNKSFRFAKFVLDEDNDVNLEFDIPLKTPNVGEVAYEILQYMVQIGDHAYPLLMKALQS